MDLTEHARRNQAVWNANAEGDHALADRQWAAEEITWGIWGVPESEVGSAARGRRPRRRRARLRHRRTSRPGSRAAARGRPASTCPRTSSRPRGASRPSTALEFPLIHASAEAVPLPDDCADVVVSEYGACLWCDPDLWLAEAARLLRPGGRLWFLTNSLLIALTTPDEGAATDRLLRDQRGLKEVTYPDEDGVEFHLAHGDWIATLAPPRLRVDALHELYAPDGAQQTKYEWVTPEWAHRWPVEEIWTATWRS